MSIKAFELVGDIDDQHHLSAQAPDEIPSGAVRLLVLVPHEDETDIAWPHGIAGEWADELADSRQDIYTLNDGRPLNAPR